ncbi:MAG: hypothetical protein P4M15_12525 [Alphaproteobacteria bacterium]|nr:hypothetical protein [Alphaproteobacteria bacterium]
MAAKIAAVAGKLPLVPMIGDGRYPLCMCHVDDLAALVLRLATLDAPPLQPITAAHETPISLRQLAESARQPGKFQMILPVPWPLLVMGLAILEAIGLRPGFRSDSVVSLVYGDRRPDFAPLRALGTAFRPYRG